MKKIALKFILSIMSIISIGACSSDDEVSTLGTVLGKVTDTTTGESMAGCIVTIVPGTESRTTGSDGYFEFHDLVPQQYEIQVRKDGYRADTKLLTVIAGQTVSGDIQLKKLSSDSQLRLSVTNLNFGSTANSLSFGITNEGIEPLNWNVSGLEGVDWLDFNPRSGTVEGGKSNAVKVIVDRSRITESKETTVIINSDRESVALHVFVER